MTILSPKGENEMGRTEASFSNEKNQETDLVDVMSKNNLKIKLKYIPRGQLVTKENIMQGIGSIKDLKESLSWGGSLLPLTVTGMECGKYLLLDGRRRLAAIDSLIADPKCEKWNKESRIAVFVIWQSVTRRFRIYGKNGRTQRVSLDKSRKFYPWDDYTKCVLLCSDRTDTKKYAELIINGPKWYIYRELQGQLDDGVFEDCGYGKITEIVNGREVPFAFPVDSVKCWNQCKGYRCKEKDWVTNLSP